MSRAWPSRLPVMLTSGRDRVPTGMQLALVSPSCESAPMRKHPHMQDDLLFLYQQLRWHLEAAYSAPLRDGEWIDRIALDMLSVERSLAMQGRHPWMLMALQRSAAEHPLGDPESASLAAIRITSASSPTVNR